MAVPSNLSILSPLPKVQLLGTAIETLLFGIFLALFPQTIYVILRHPKAVSLGSVSRLNKSIVAVCGVLFCSLAAHWILGLVSISVALSNNAPPSLEYLSNPSNPLTLARFVLLHPPILCQDFILVYRLYIVWDRKKYVIVLPTLSFLCTIALQFPLISCELSSQTPDGAATNPVQQALIIAIYSTTLFTNIYCLLMIGFRIWRAQSNRLLGNIRQESGTGRPLSILFISIECAGVYTLAIILSLILFLLNSPAEFPVQDITGSLVGVSLCLVVLRVKVLREHQQPQFHRRSFHIRSFR